MISDEFSFSYTPVNPGTEKTTIIFYNSKTNDVGNSLSSIFWPDIIPSTESCQIKQAAFQTEESRVRQAQSAPQVQKHRRLFVTDSNVASMPFFSDFKNKVDESNLDALLILEPGEKNKTIDNVLKIVKAGLEHNMQRSSVFVGIGGGVICDMTAFASSIFKRGAKLELVPTTLLAMVDASIGGKTGCDFDDYKNMIGTFFPAATIHIMSSCCKTLSETEYRSGLGEVFKTALLYAPKLFQILETEHDAVMAKSDEILNQLIKRCVQAKAHIVERDLMESGLRMQLNFGHTFAHALETTAGLGSIPHGDAVVWGICRAAALSLRLGICEKEYYDEVLSAAALYGWETTPLPLVLLNMLQNNDSSNNSIKYKTEDEIRKVLLNSMTKDKKNNENSVRFILQREINSTILSEVSADDILAVL